MVHIKRDYKVHSILFRRKGFICASFLQICAVWRVEASCTARTAQCGPQIDSLREAEGWSTYWMTVNLHHHAELCGFRGLDE